MPQLLAAPPAGSAPSLEVAEPAPFFTKETVAELSLCEIEALTRDELVAAIRAVVVPFVDHDRLDFQERTTLLRLLYLARQCCRNQGY